MYKISIANEKGGVAKTTTTISLGAALAETGCRVLLVDLDAQANLSLATGVDVGTVDSTVFTHLIQSLPLNSTILSTAIPNVDIIPSKYDVGLIERYLPIQPNYEYKLRNGFGENPLDYQFVIFDCPPFLGATTLSALVASDLLLLPTQAEFFSIYALRNLMELVKRIRHQYNPKLTYRLLITMFDRRNRIHRILREQLQESFANGMLKTIIEVDTKLRESVVSGIPIFSHAPKSRAALQYRALAQEILEYSNCPIISNL
jgi:chromosome partitioning protein